jgi:hypothetical protein
VAQLWIVRRQTPAEYNTNRTMNAPSPITTPETSSDAITKSALKRYRDAYLVARAITGVGGSVKFIAVALFVVLFLAGIYVSTKSQGQLPYSVGGVLLGLIVGVIVGVPLYILGILVSAVGELLKSTLDTAVHGSPFLADDQKAIAMSLAGAKGVQEKEEPKWSWGW